MCGYLQCPEVLDALELELHEVVSHLTWVLGMELQVFGRTATSADFKDLKNINFLMGMVVHACSPST